MEFIAAWLGELDDERRRAQQELEDAIEAQRAVKLARDTARTEHQAQRAAIAGIQRLAGPLVNRLRWADEELHQLESSAAGATVRVDAACRLIAEIDEAVEQLKLVTTQHDDAEAEMNAEGAISPDLERVSRVYG
jgi:hypothetical protein